MANPYISYFPCIFWLPGRVPRTPRSSEGRRIVPLKFSLLSVSYPGFAQAAQQTAPASSQYSLRFESLVSQDVTKQVRPYLICRFLITFMILWCVAWELLLGFIYSCIIEYIRYGVLILLWMFLVKILMNRMEGSLQEFEVYFRGSMGELNRAFLGGEIQTVAGPSMRWLEILPQGYQPPQMRVDVMPMGIPI